MKNILIKLAISLISSIAIIIIGTLLKGYFQPFQSILVILLIHIMVLVVYLIELINKNRYTLRILPPGIVFLLFLLWSMISPDSSDGNDFFLVPLSISFAQVVVIGFEFYNKNKTVANSH